MPSLPLYTSGSLVPYTVRPDTHSITKLNGKLFSVITYISTEKHWSFVWSYRLHLHDQRGTRQLAGFFVWLTVLLFFQGLLEKNMEFIKKDSTLQIHCLWTPRNQHSDEIFLIFVLLLFTSRKLSLSLSLYTYEYVKLLLLRSRNLQNFPRFAAILKRSRDIYLNLTLPLSFIQIYFNILVTSRSS
jgi:hypothetical protein